MPGLILAAPSSGTGKTTLTLGLLRALTQRGVAVQGAKSGPDYIDPGFHRAACGRTCFNLDAWAMTPDRIRSWARTDDLLVIEGAMGLFDGAPPDGRGSCADLAQILRLPVVLIVDAARMAHSVAPLVAGFLHHDPNVRIVGVILNRVGSPRHATMLKRALAPLDLPVLGALPRLDDLHHPSRHLGLVQAEERADLEAYLDQAASAVGDHVDLDRLCALAAPLPPATPSRKRKPPAQRIALARDRAFSFAYPHLLEDWRNAGAEIVPFSPLADDPVPPCDLIYLPGGYPELFARDLARAGTFMASLRSAAQETDVYGECGGYMVLGNSLTDAGGTCHPMAGLLDLDTSFAQRRLHLGYRRLHGTHGPFRGAFMAHEFHYASTLHARGKPLFNATDAEETPLAPMGLIRGRVCGSFAHIIDTAD